MKHSKKVVSTSKKVNGGSSKSGKSGKERKKKRADSKRSVRTSGTPKRAADQDVSGKVGQQRTLEPVHVRLGHEQWEI